MQQKEVQIWCKKTHKIWSDCVDWGDKRRYLWLFWFKSGVMFEGGLCGIMGSYVISPLWSLGGGIAWDAQQGSTLSPTGASERSASLGCSHCSGDKRADEGDHILVCRRTNLSWRRHGLPPAQPPCRWTTPPSRSSPPRIMLSYTFLMWPHFNLENRLPTSPGIQTQCSEQRERWLPHDVKIRAIFAELFHFEVAWSGKNNFHYFLVFI